MLAQDMLQDVAKPLRPIETLDERLRAIILERFARQPLVNECLCPFCGRPFSGARALATHMLQIHAAP